MTRYRLRFLLQEFDLARGATLIGRSSECQVTIEDPLVSRQHARILIEGDEVRVEDLRSRNGVKVNGLTIKGPTLLKDGDRLRVGTQELVLCTAMQASQVSAKTTGFLRHCATCRLPYPKEIGLCPSCGATEQTDEDTLSGQFGESSQGTWSMQLLVEVLQKALSLGRASDAERILRRATAQVEERVLRGEHLEPKQLQAVCAAAAAVSADSGDPAWGAWIADVHRRMAATPGLPVVDLLIGLALRYPDEVGGAVRTLLAHLRASGRPPSAEEAESLGKLEGIRVAVEQAHASARVCGTAAVS